MLNFKSPPLPFFIESVQTHIDEGKCYPARSNVGVFNIVYVKKGKLFISENNVDFTINTGEYIILRPDTKSSSKQLCDQESIIEDIQFTTTSFWEEVNALSTPQLFGDYYSHVLHIKKSHSIKKKKKIESIFDKLRKAALSGEAESFWERQQHFIELLKFLDDEWRASEAKATTVVAEKAAAFIKENYREHLTNARLADELGYHINYISRSMDEVYSMTPQQYLMFYRIDQAKLLLLRTELTIAQIAKQIGFKQTPHFSRLFAHNVGVSPLKYRKKYTT